MSAARTDADVEALKHALSFATRAVRADEDESDLSLALQLYERCIHEIRMVAPRLRARQRDLLLEIDVMYARRVAALRRALRRAAASATGPRSRGGSHHGVGGEAGHGSESRVSREELWFLDADDDLEPALPFEEYRTLNQSLSTTFDATARRLSSMEAALVIADVFNMPPEPTEPILRPFWLFHQVAFSAERGAMIGPALFVPRDVWTQDGAPLVFVDIKCDILTVLIRALRRFHLVLQPDSRANPFQFHRELDEFVDRVRRCHDVLHRHMRDLRKEQPPSPTRAAASAPTASLVTDAGPADDGAGAADDAAAADAAEEGAPSSSASSGTSTAPTSTLRPPSIPRRTTESLDRAAGSSTAPSSSSSSSSSTSSSSTATAIVSADGAADSAGSVSGFRRALRGVGATVRRAAQATYEAVTETMSAPVPRAQLTTYARLLADFGEALEPLGRFLQAATLPPRAIGSSRTSDELLPSGAPAPSSLSSSSSSSTATSAEGSRVVSEPVFLPYAILPSDFDEQWCQRARVLFGRGRRTESFIRIASFLWDTLGRAVRQDVALIVEHFLQRAEYNLRSGYTTGA